MNSSKNIETELMFLLYSPLNQGLKLEANDILEKAGYEVFTLQSIKSRIETIKRIGGKIMAESFYSTVH